MQIKADPIQLKAFLNVIKNELFPDKESSGKKTNTNIRAFGSTKMLLDKVFKMTIKERSALTKGLPRTLRELHINEIGIKLNASSVSLFTQVLFRLLTDADRNPQFDKFINP